MKRLALSFCAACVVMLVSTSAYAAPITFNFRTELPLGTLFGTGSFTFDDSLLPPPTPSVITQSDLTSFSYSDPIVGALSLSASAPASFNLTFGFNPATSGFSFVATAGPSVFIGGVVNGNNVGGASLSIGPNGGFAQPFLRFPTAQVLPEPGVLLLMGLGFAGLLRSRRSRP